MFLKDATRQNVVMFSISIVQHKYIHSARGKEICYWGSCHSSWLWSAIILFLLCTDIRYEFALLLGSKIHHLITRGDWKNSHNAIISFCFLLVYPGSIFSISYKEEQNDCMHVVLIYSKY